MEELNELNVAQEEGESANIWSYFITGYSNKGRGNVFSSPFFYETHHGNFENIN